MRTFRRRTYSKCCNKELVRVADSSKLFKDLSTEIVDLIVAYSLRFRALLSIQCFITTRRRQVPGKRSTGVNVPLIRGDARPRTQSFVLYQIKRQRYFTFWRASVQIQPPIWQIAWCCNRCNAHFANKVKKKDVLGHLGVVHSIHHPVKNRITFSQYITTRIVPNASKSTCRNQSERESGDASTVKAET